MDNVTQAEMKRRAERITNLLDSTKQQIEAKNAWGVAMFAEYLEQQVAALVKEAKDAAKP